MTSSTPKGYCLADIAVHDAEAHARYTEHTGPAVQAAGGRFLIRGGAPQVLEGDRRITHITVAEFDSVPAARAFYRGAQYQAAIPDRQAAARCEHLILTGNDPDAAGPPAPGGPKGYILAEMHPTDLEKYMEYPRMSTPIVQRFGGRFVVRGGQPEHMEGGRSAGRIVLAEFPSVEQARAFYFSPEYQQAMRWRLQYARSDLCLLAGV